MSWTPGSGELGQRIARGLDIKGRVQPEIDELIVPVATVVDLGEPPHRTDGVFAFFGGRADAAALQFPIVGIWNPTSQNQVLEDFVIGAAVTTEYQVSLATDAIAGVPLGGALSTNNLTSTENVQAGQLDGLIQTPLQYATYSLPNFPPIGTTPIARAIASGNTPWLVTLGIVLPPLKQIFIGIAVTGATLTASVRCRYFRVARR